MSTVGVNPQSPRDKQQAMQQAAPLMNVSPPRISPVRGKYEWNRQEGGGVLVTFAHIPRGCHLHWRFEWIRNGYTYGCKYYGFTRAISEYEDFSSSFRIQPHRMGFLRREKGYKPILEFNYPGRYNLQAWFSDKDHNLISPVTEEFYEVVNVSPPAPRGQPTPLANQGEQRPQGDAGKH